MEKINDRAEFEPPAVPPGCKQCPHVVGDTYQRDCGYPDCSPRASSPPPEAREGFYTLNQISYALNRSLYAKTGNLAIEGIIEDLRFALTGATSETKEACRACKGTGVIQTGTPGERIACDCPAGETRAVQDTDNLAWCVRVHEDLALYIKDSGGDMIHTRAHRALGIMFTEMAKLEKALWPLTK